MFIEKKEIRSTVSVGVPEVSIAFKHRGFFSTHTFNQWFSLQQVSDLGFDKKQNWKVEHPLSHKLFISSFLSSTDFWGFLSSSQILKCGSWFFLSRCFLPSWWYPAAVVSELPRCAIELWPGHWGWCEEQRVWGALTPSCSPDAPMAKLTASWRPLTFMLTHTPPSTSVHTLVSMHTFVYVPGALKGHCVLWGKTKTQNFNIYNINEVIIQP